MLIRFYCYRRHHHHHHHHCCYCASVLRPLHYDDKCITFAFLSGYERLSTWNLDTALLFADSLLNSGVTRNAGAPGQNIQAGRPFSFLSLILPLPFPLRGFDLKCSCSYTNFIAQWTKFSAVMQWILCLQNVFSHSDWGNKCDRQTHYL